MKIVWNGLLPSFHNWFITHRADIIRSKLVLSARTKLNISGRFYTNSLESVHHLQKKFLAEEGHKPVNVVEVNVFLVDWINEFNTELVRALRGMGRYRLAVGYQDFFVEPVKWNQWRPDRRQKHVDKFLKFRPTEIQCYRKPLSAGLKKEPRPKRRIEKGEAEIFIDRAATLPPTTSQVTPIKLSKVSQELSDGDTSTWSVVESSVHNDPLNPDRHVSKEYFLVHRNDHKNCPHYQ